MKLLFVCTGNTCRSPLAAAIARKVAIEHGMHDVDAASAGTSAWEGAPASDGAMLVGIERQLDLDDHRARLLSERLVADADIVLVMGPNHLDRANAMGGEGKSWLLTEYASRGVRRAPITDPIGAELTVYRETADELEREIRLVFDRLAAERAPSPE